MSNIKYEYFKDLDLRDSFFDSLKESYKEFSEWFEKKAKENEKAYVFYNSKRKLDAFIYLKCEVKHVNDIEPPLPKGKTLKIGTFKINAHGTKLGERLLKKTFDHAINDKSDYIYVTVFEKELPLIRLLEKYGFKKYGLKKTHNGVEEVLVRELKQVTGNVIKDFPHLSLEDKKCYLLAIYPEYHSQFLPDSILNNENHDILEDISYTNSIHKIYISGISRTKNLRPGDIICIYRTSDGKGKAYYRSVVSSIGVVEEVKQIKSFSSEDAFMKYVRPYSVFKKEELKDYFTNRKKRYIIKFTYNGALKKRLIRGRLIDDCGISDKVRWDFISLTKEQFRWIAEEGQVNEGIIID
ncbi:MULTISPECIES: GNAT family N-acetyltransferase [Pectobacterium]|uniref:GNAT family N-acetyltransferase n=1 Tax=Pectobacterium TaxID=122277 RepID=UPI000CD172A9|nr:MULTISPECIES: N-acetyltransferase [Pectobacterium]MBQ4778586.1 N-acetyltransferase [Pectobacterium versatile]POD90090.1 N-acetyltransferase [Pectobacterium odoriferum]